MSKHTKRSPGKTIRQKIYDRDGNKCCLCGDPRNLTLDHIIPRSKGGNGAMNNLQTLCASCNSIKGSQEAPFDIEYIVAHTIKKKNKQFLPKSVSHTYYLDKNCCNCHSMIQNACCLKCMDRHDSSVMVFAIP